ncbi:MAG: glycosyltransferase [Acidobacteria bacterium]|nr:glycosyltransferase [Acidobacteriota bacterium]
MSKKPIKSVHLTNYYHKNSGGVSTNYNKLLEAAERHRRFVRLIVPGEHDAVEEINEFAKIYYVAAPPSPIIDKRYRLMMPWQYIQNETPIRKILIDEMPDMIEIYDNYSLTLLAGIIRKGKFSQVKRPMLVYFTGERFDTIVSSFVSKGKIGQWFARRLIGNYNLPMFDFYIANSPFVAEELIESVRGEDNPHRSETFFNKCWQFFRASKIPFTERLKICPRGVDTVRFNPSKASDRVRREMREKAGIPENSVVVMSSTRLSTEKNIQVLPEIMEVLAKDERTDFRLLVAGAGPKAEWIAEETEKRFPGKIVQTGHLDKETLAEYYASADVFLHPNPREPFGNVALEAMASGVAVVVPNAGGVLSYANEENAWLSEPTAGGFAATIRKAFEDEPARARKIERALETVAAHTTEAANDLLFATYDAMYEDFERRNDFFAYQDVSKADKFTDLYYTNLPTH